jgi:hypothetical protein
VPTLLSHFETGPRDLVNPNHERGFQAQDCTCNLSGGLGIGHSRYHDLSFGFSEVFIAKHVMTTISILSMSIASFPTQSNPFANLPLIGERDLFISSRGSQAKKSR